MEKPILTKRSKRALLRSFHFLASSVSHGPEDKQNFTHH